MRPREKGKSCDPDDLQTLNPWPESWAPPRELSGRKKAWVEHPIWTLSPRPLRVLSLRVLAVPPRFNTPRGSGAGGASGGEMRATEDGWSWWLKLNTHPLQEFSCRFPLFPRYFSFRPPAAPRRPARTGEAADEWETCWQEGAKWIWVMGSWAMCLFYHLVATPSVLWWSACGRKESSPSMDSYTHTHDLTGSS